jgi:hypothetical protein
MSAEPVTPDGTPEPDHVEPSRWSGASGTGQMEPHHAAPDAEDTTAATEDTPAVAAPGPEQDPQAAARAELAASVAAALEDAARTVEADLAAFDESNMRFLLQVDAHIAAERQHAATHPTPRTRRRNGLLDGAHEMVAAMCSPGRRAA